MVMFSATISREVMDIGWLYQRDTVELTVEPVKESQPKIHQYMLESGGRQKLAAVNFAAEKARLLYITVIKNIIA